MKTLCVFLITLFLLGTSFARQDFGGLTGELAEMFRQTNGTNLTRRSIDAMLQRKEQPKPEISEVGIERTRCYGRCPAYTFIVRSNGTFRYVGRSDVPHIGEFTGKLPAYEFDRLALFIRDSGFMEFEDEYTAAVTDSPTTYTTVVMNGKRKLIRNYAHSGPSKLWAIEELIDGLLAHAAWDSTPVKPK
jgi:hypothetical protein